MAFSGDFYGFRPCGSVMGISDVIMEFNSGGTFTKYDAVMFDGSGEVIIATAGASYVAGISMESTITASSTNVQINVTPGLCVIADNDNVSATFAATYVGEGADIIGATGLQGIDTDTHSESTPLTMICLAYNPKGFGVDDDISIGKYMLHEHIFN